MKISLPATFIDRSRYYLTVEYRTKMRAAVEALPADALWWRPRNGIPRRLDAALRTLLS